MPDLGVRAIWAGQFTEINHQTQPQGRVHLRVPGPFHFHGEQRIEKNTVKNTP